MDSKLFTFCLNEWKKINNSLGLVTDCINGRVIDFGKREILYNLFKGVNRRSYRIIKILEEARLEAVETNEDIEEKK